MKVKVINKSENSLPQYATPLSAGMDVRAANEQPIKIDPLQRAIVPTGLFLEIPARYGGAGCDVTRSGWFDHLS